MHIRHIHGSFSRVHHFLMELRAFPEVATFFGTAQTSLCDTTCIEGRV